MNLKEIREYSGGDKEVEAELVGVTRRLEKAVGHPGTMVEALSLFGWLVHQVITFEDLLRDPLEPIGYREAAAIVASLCDRFGLTQDEMLTAYHRSPLEGPEFDRAREAVREKLERAGIPVMFETPKPKKRRRGKRKGGPGSE